MSSECRHTEDPQVPRCSREPDPSIRAGEQGLEVGRALGALAAQAGAGPSGAEDAGGQQEGCGEAGRAGGRRRGRSSALPVLRVLRKQEQEREMTGWQGSGQHPAAQV